MDELRMGSTASFVAQYEGSKEAQSLPLSGCEGRRAGIVVKPGMEDVMNIFTNLVPIYRFPRRERAGVVQGTRRPAPARVLAPLTIGWPG